MTVIVRDNYRAFTGSPQRHSATLTPTAAHGIKTVRFTVKCRPLVPLALRRREKRPFGPYSTDRLIDLGRRLFMKLHSINEFRMFKIAISPVKNR